MPRLTGPRPRYIRDPGDSDPIEAAKKVVKAFSENENAMGFDCVDAIRALIELVGDLRERMDALEASDK